MHEFMPITQEIERLAAARASAAEVEEVAMAQGMVNLRSDGMGKALSWKTSLEEVLRVVL